MSKVNSVAGEFRKVSDLQMVETTKRTIRENATISQQLTKMSGKTMALLRENEVLLRKETEMSRRVELLEASHRELTRKNASNQKVLISGGTLHSLLHLVFLQVILLLQEKGREQERELEDLRDTATQSVELEREARQATEHAATTTINSKVCKTPSPTHPLTGSLFSLTGVQRTQPECGSRAGHRADTAGRCKEENPLTHHHPHPVSTSHPDCTSGIIIPTPASPPTHTSLCPLPQGSSSEAEHQAKRQGLLTTLLQLLTSSPQAHLTPYTPGDLGIVPPSSAKRRPTPNQPIPGKQL